MNLHPFDYPLYVYIKLKHLGKGFYERVMGKVGKIRLGYRRWIR